jgi:hypothetical protein
MHRFYAVNSLLALQSISSNPSLPDIAVRTHKAIDQAVSRTFLGRPKRSHPFLEQHRSSRRLRQACESTEGRVNVGRANSVGIHASFGKHTNIQNLCHWCEDSIPDAPGEFRGGLQYLVDSTALLLPMLRRISITGVAIRHLKAVGGGNIVNSTIFPG